jgi:hypothetical protein
MVLSLWWTIRHITPVVTINFKVFGFRAALRDRGLAGVKSEAAPPRGLAPLVFGGACLRRDRDRTSNSRLQSTAILPQMFAKQQRTGEWDND